MELVNLETLLYWMKERESIRLKKEAGEPRPWSDNAVFQTTYFCNVHREDDRVTRFIRQMYSPHVKHELFEANIILSRFLNWPDTLKWIGYQKTWDPVSVNTMLKSIDGKVWGGAYVVSTCGRQMNKIDYLTEIVMPSIEFNTPFGATTCEVAADAAQRILGVSTFMAGQVVADLKNTSGHDLQKAWDWSTFALIGPGSRRGMEWLCAERMPDKDWYKMLALLQARLYTEGWQGLCAQDIQNVLCEFSKFCRVSSGTGRSKRGYHGI